jgi:hypothetical protein
MAKDVQVKQTSLEERVFPIEWSPALLDGVTVSSVALTHTPPSGSAASFSNEQSGTLGYVKSPSGLAVGKHLVSCVATTSNSALSPEVRLIIRVDY